METTAEEWIERCAQRLLERTPGLDKKFAGVLAATLHAAWPKLTPESAVACYFAPTVDVAGSSCAVELA